MNLLEFNNNDRNALDHDYRVLIEFYKQYLEVSRVEDIEVFVPSDDGEEVWHLPQGFTTYLQIKECSTPMFSIGSVHFGTLDGVKVITEQNASPIIFMRKATLCPTSK